MTEAIVVKGLSKYYGGKCVVNDLDLKVHQGEVFGFLGPNGSGKTTTMRMLCGLIKPDKGYGRCLGLDITNQVEDIKDIIGYMPQKFSYYHKMTVEENMQFVSRIRGGISHDRIKTVMQDFDLWDKRSQFAGDLSGGWKQRLSLAACLLHAPKLMLLDEPTAGVDPESRRYFWDVIHDLANKGVTILVTTHYMDEAERCNRLAFISQGKLVNTGSKDSIIETSSLHVFSLKGRDIYEVAKEIERMHPDIMVVVFGSAIHLCTRNKSLPASVGKCIEHHGIHAHLTKVDTTIEHIFIELVRHKGDCS